VIEDENHHLSGATLLGIGMEMPEAQRVPSPEALRAEADRYERMRFRTRAEIASEIESINAGDSAASRRLVDAAATNALTDFFIKTCHLSKQKADLRSAKIGNAVLGWTVTFRERADGPERPRGF
jgi:hypothetical protein